MATATADYELMVVLDPTLETETVEQNLDRFADLINKTEGKVKGIDKWGRRKLAYEIKRRLEGFYAVFDFQATPATLEELRRVLKISDPVLRHMIVRRGE